MYRQHQIKPTKLSINKGYKGETIEIKVKRITTEKTPITDGAPLIYTDRKDGVMPDYNIRTDRFEYAIEAMDKVTKARIAKREARHNPTKNENTIGKEAQQGMKNEGETKPTQN